MHFLQEAVLNFVYKLEEVDTALVVSFNESVKGSAEFTGDTDRLERFVEGLQAWGGTSLYDAIHYSLGRIKDQPGRKAVIVFTRRRRHHEPRSRTGRSSTTRARWRPRSTASASRARARREPARLPAQDRDGDGRPVLRARQGGRAHQGLQRDLEGAQEPLPARLHAEARARRLAGARSC